MPIAIQYFSASTGTTTAILLLPLTMCTVHNTC